jgi:hypothetical protein
MTIPLGYSCLDRYIQVYYILTTMAEEVVAHPTQLDPLSINR